MKKLWILLALIFLVGCGPTAAQLAAEKDYYAAFSSKNQTQQPLFEMIASNNLEPIVLTNVARIIVYSPPAQYGPQIQQYQHRDYAAPWIGLLGNAVAVAAPWVGLSFIANSFKDMHLGQAGGTNYYQTVSGTNNTALTKTAGNSSLSGGITGSSNQVGGMFDNTAPPFTVNPVIVPAQVVNPVIVEK
jgi:hypothetical protein